MPPATIRFRWLGVAGIELALNDQVLLIDPFLSRPPFWRMWFGRVQLDRRLVSEKIARCDFVLVTHGHWDHLMDVPEVLRSTGATAVGSPNTCGLLAQLGVPREQIRQVGAGDRLVLGPFQVEVLPAEHRPFPGWRRFSGPLPDDLRPPLRLRDYRMDVSFSFLIEIAGWRLLDWGSDDLRPAVPAEVLFVGAESTPAYYEALLRCVQPRVVIPVHWDDLFRPLSRTLRPMLRPPAWTWPPLRRMDMAEFKQWIETVSPRAKVLIPEIFRRYDLSEV